jgi:hypothetical protein
VAAAPSPRADYVRPNSPHVEIQRHHSLHMPFDEMENYWLAGMYVSKTVTVSLSTVVVVTCF